MKGRKAVKARRAKVPVKREVMEEAAPEPVPVPPLEAVLPPEPEPPPPEPAPEAAVPWDEAVVGPAAIDPASEHVNWTEPRAVTPPVFRAPMGEERRRYLLGHLDGMTGQHTAEIQQLLDEGYVLWEQTFCYVLTEKGRKALAG